MLHLSHGEDDVVGGLATVQAVEVGVSKGEPVHYIHIQEVDGSYNWEHFLANVQERLREEFGSQVAHAQPDKRPEFNER